MLVSTSVETNRYGRNCEILVQYYIQSNKPKKII